jgi:hypothetical protein
MSTVWAIVSSVGSECLVLTTFQEAGIIVDPMADFNTETERELGRIVKEK